MLRIHNSLTRKKETFEPIEPGRVRMYVCGMTVYDYCHLGHARVLVVFDVVVRYLRERGYDVTYVRNITDIDDKIIRRAQEGRVSIAELTDRFILAMHEDCESLDVVPPDIEPRATQSMDSIIRMVQVLVDNGFAYQAENGDVYYDISRFSGYGMLSGRDLGDERAGARVEIDEAKDDPLDFVLWKAAKAGEPSWDSPWGAGRPGWHIECSAMSTDTLGDHFDIHGGGMDLKFPHHENEIAQSEAATGHKFVNIWMHNGFVEVDEEKMSKSLGNFFTVREILQRYKPEEIRYFILSSHYRSPLNYSDENLEMARAALKRLYTAVRNLPAAAADISGDSEYMTRFHDAMDDDFNTPEVLAILFDLAHAINRTRDTDLDQAARLGAQLKRIGHVLGLLQRDAEVYLKEASSGVEQETAMLPDEVIEVRILEREQARQQNNWAEADRIREDLAAQGVILEDGSGGTTWRRG